APGRIRGSPPSSVGAARTRPAAAVTTPGCPDPPPPVRPPYEGRWEPCFRSPQNDHTPSIGYLINSTITVLSSPCAVGPRLRAVAADFHRAPSPRTVPGVVVEGPLTVLGGAGLDPLPASSRLGVGDGRQEPREQRAGAGSSRPGNGLPR